MTKRNFILVIYNIVKNCSNKRVKSASVFAPPLPHQGHNEFTEAENLQSTTHTGPPTLGLLDCGCITFCCIITNLFNSRRIDPQDLGNNWPLKGSRELWRDFTHVDQLNPVQEFGPSAFYIKRLSTHFYFAPRQLGSICRFH